MIKHTMALALTLTAVTLPAAAHAATTVSQSLDTNASWTAQNTTTNSPIVQAIVPLVVPSIYVGGGASAPGDNQQNTALNGAFWIYPSAGGNHAQNNTFAFTKIFLLSGVNLTTAVLSGKYWSDNGIVSILLNGSTIFGPVAPGTAGSAPTTTFSSGTGSNLNYSGNTFGSVNTLVFNVRNGAGTSGNPVSLLADIEVAAAVPEPGTWMLMLLGFGAIGFAMRSRAKTQVRFQFA